MKLTVIAPQWPPQRMIDRFWQHVRKPDRGGDCWVWTGAKDTKGNGIMSLYCVGKHVTRYVQLKAHRVSWAVSHGTFPRGNLIRKMCCSLNACVNPAHLRVARSRLDAVRAAAIKSETENSNDTHGAIAARYDVDVSTVCKIANGKIWTKAAMP